MFFVKLRAGVGLLRSDSKTVTLFIDLRGPYKACGNYVHSLGHLKDFISPTRACLPYFKRFLRVIFGETDPVVLEFRPLHSKEMAIAQMVTRVTSIDWIDEELKKNGGPMRYLS